MSQANHGRSSLLERLWSRLSLRGRGLTVMAIPLALAFAALLFIFWAESDVREAEQQAVGAASVRADVAQLQSSLVRAQSARALASGDAAYRSERAEAQRITDRLLHLLDRDPYNAAQFRPLAPLIAEQLRRLDALPANAAAEQSGMAGLQARLQDISNEQEQIFARAELLRDAARERAVRILIACAVLGTAGALLIHFVVVGRLGRRLGAVQENARRLAAGQPLNPFPPGVDEVASLARQLDSAAILLRAREVELRASETRSRDLFDRAPVPYEETDRAGTVRRVNQAVCALLKAAPDQITGRGAWDFVSPDQQDAVRAAMLDRIKRGVETGPFECDYILADGTRIAVEVRESLMRDETGEVVGVVRSLLDVTERNIAAMAARKVEQYALELRNKNEQLARALDAARSATQAKSRFLASISHELRTPLNGIIGFSELLHDNRLGTVTSEQKDVLGDILTSARHLLQLINDILDISRVEAGKMEFRPEDVRIAAVANEVRDVMRPLADKKRLHLSVEAPPDLVAWLDAARFKQVLYNYLSNAVKFTPEDGSVHLRILRQDEAFMMIEVEDTGIGIPAAELSRLFQEFQQVPNSRSAEQGAGLGLALTRHIVEAQGGSVSVRSAPGHGSVFSAVLPIRSSRTNRN